VVVAAVVVVAQPPVVLLKRVALAVLLGFGPLELLILAMSPYWLLLLVLVAPLAQLELQAAAQAVTA
jgi:hypothetical protein